MITEGQKRRLIGKVGGGVRMRLGGPQGERGEQTESVLVRHADPGARLALALNSHHMQSLN